MNYFLTGSTYQLRKKYDSHREGRTFFYPFMGIQYHL